jgi:hypothetical protein
VASLGACSGASQRQTPQAGSTCRPANLALQLLDSGEATFNTDAVWGLTNTSATPCSLDGYPIVTTYHSSGGVRFASRVAVEVRYAKGVPGWITEHAQRRPPRGPTHVVLKPGHRAAFIFTYQTDPTATTPCPTTVFSIRLPGSNDAITSSTPSVSVCPGPYFGDLLIVSPIVPSSSLPANIPQP